MVVSLYDCLHTVLFRLRLDVSLRLWLAVCNDKITLQLQSLLSSLEAH